MSIIQTIRDKAAWLVFALIAVSLIGFLLMDASVGRSRMGGGGNGKVGSVDGTSLENADYARQISEREDQYKQQGFPVNESMQQNIREQVWREFEDGAVLQKACDQLGLQVTDPEIDDMLTGDNAIPEIRRAFTDPKTGVYDAVQAKSYIARLTSVYKGKKKSDQNYEMARRFFEEGVPQIVKARLREKYLSLLSKSIYIPKWMVEKSNADNSQVASISYINVPYTSIPDSTVKVSDAEITDYVSKHADQYQQPTSRSISYVMFSAAPTSADSAAVKSQLEQQRPEFAATTDMENFFARNASEIPYGDAYTPKAKLVGPMKDSIIAMPKGAIAGPYLDGGNFVLVKKVDEKTMPDSVRARHILIATTDPQSHQQIVDDSVAKKKIDSIKNLIDHGQRFDSLAAHFSDDPGSKAKGGDLGYFGPGTMVPEFNEFCFSGKPGERKIVKTQFGYHLIEIVDQKGFGPAYKLAYFARKIDASSETDNNASGLASQFAGENRSATAFDDAAKKQKLQILTATNIEPQNYSVQGLGASRQLVQWIYEAKVGDVSQSYSLDDKYIVALLTATYKKGTMEAANARTTVEPILRARKKADLIATKLGKPASLEAAAQGAGVAVQKSDSIQFSSPYIPNLGPEPKVVGYAFDKSLTGKPVSDAVGGNYGVFLIHVDNVSARANMGADVEQARQMQTQRLESVVQQQALEPLKKVAKVTDNRGNF